MLSKKMRLELSSLPHQTVPYLTSQYHAVPCLTRPHYAAPSPQGLIGSEDIIPYLAENSYNILSVDLNNCVMDQIGGIVRASKGRLKVSDFDKWDVDLSPKMGMSRDAYLAWAWQNPYTELLSLPFPDATSTLWHIKKAGIQIWIVTATVLSQRDIRGWLGCNGIPFDRVIKTQDKAGIGDVLIDDSPLTLQKFYDAQMPVLRFELTWNKHLDYVKGVKWSETTQYA